MASLTNSLPGVNSAARIIDPQNNKGPTFLQGLANIAEMAVTGGARLYEKNAAESARTAAATAKAQEEATKNDTAQLILDHGTQRGAFAPSRLNPEPQQTQDNGYVPIDPELEGPPLPAGVERTVGEVSRARAAENQGRAPSGSSQIMLESAISKLRAEHPDNQDVILDYIKAQGFDHYLFRDRDLQRKAEDTEIDAVIKGQQSYYDEAIKAGTIAPGTPLEEGARVGRQQAQAVEQMRLAKEARDAQAFETKTSQDQIEFNNRQDDRGAVARGIQFATAGLGPLLTQFEAMGVEALQDPNNTKTFEQAVPEFGLQIDNVINQTRAVMATNGERPEAIEAATAQLRMYKDNLVSFTSGPLSQFAQSKRTLESMQTRLGMNIQESLPIYMGLKEVMGQGAINELFPAGAASALPPSVIQELKGEMSNIVGAINTDPERLSMANVAQLLRGQTNINRMSETQARQVLPSLVAVSRGSAQDYVQTGGAGTAFYNSTLQVANAAAGLQPGTTSGGGESLVVATTALFNPTGATAIHKFRQANPDEGQQLVESTRGASIHLFKALQSRQLTPEETQGGAWSVVYQSTGPRAGTYQSVLTRQAYDRWAASQSRVTDPGAVSSLFLRNGNRVQSYEEMLRNPPRAVQSHVGALNLNLNYLVSTKDYDEDFKGVNVRETREFFARDEVPSAMRARSEGENSSKSFNERLTELRQGFQSVTQDAVNQQISTTSERNSRFSGPPVGELQATVKDRAERMGLPWTLVNRLVGRESTWDANAENSSTQARGLFQINDNKTDRTLDENINDGLGLVKESMQIASRTLGRPAFDWETYVVHQQGPGGGPALLKPENANRSALEVLTAAYRGNSRLATQAIVGNGGNTSMTAAQFARAIKNFYEG